MTERKLQFTNVLPFFFFFFFIFTIATSLLMSIDMLLEGTHTKKTETTMARERKAEQMILFYYVSAQRKERKVKFYYLARFESVASLSVRNQ